MFPVKDATCLVLIQHKTTTAGDWNPVVSWGEFRRAWVSIRPDRGREVFKGAELETTVTHTIRGDFLALQDVDETMRVIYNDTHDYASHGIRADSMVFDILAVMPDHEKRGDCMVQASLKPLRLGELPADIPQ